jgi:hypothetical protein
MTTLRLIWYFFSLLLISCNSNNGNTIPNSKDSFIEVKTVMTEIPSDYEISWRDSGNVKLDIDPGLSHGGGAFKCDSVIAIDYIGSLGEHTYLPLNNKGQWINTISKRKKLLSSQIDSLNSILGDKTSFVNPMQVACYEPRLGIVYFRKGKVIAQSTICLLCARLESTAKLGNKESYSSFNKRTLRRLERICTQLDFSNCKNWTE